MIQWKHARSFKLLLCIALVLTSYLGLATAASAAESVGPQNLRVVNVTANTAVLEWDFLEDVRDIDIWNADTNAWITWGNNDARTISVAPETTYRIYITWHKDRPSLEFKSNIVEFTTPALDPNDFPEPPLTPPSNLTVTEITYSSIELGWDGSPGANGYDVYVNGGWAGGVWDGSNRFTFAVPESTVTGAVYTFQVGAQLAEPDKPTKVSANSNAVTITWGELTAPRDLQLITATKSTAYVGWAPSPGASSYDVYLDGEWAGETDDNRYVFDGLTEGRTYAVKVVAKNDLWISPASDDIDVTPGKDYTIFKYFTAWSVYDRGYHPEDVDVSKVTHINYAFADICWYGVGSNGADCQVEELPLQQDYVHNGEIVIGDKGADPVNFAKFQQIRDDNPHLNVMISVGGWSWSNNFSDMAADEVTRHAFANSVVDFLREYELDGIDIDWEYPVEGGEDDNSRRPEDKENFTKLFQLMREKLDAAGQEDGKYYLLTIASGQGDNFVVNADLANSVNYMDFINIMTYDYSGSWDKVPFHNSPLYYDPANPISTAARFNVHGGVNGHLTGGVPNYKLVMGVPFYGKGWMGCAPEGQYQNCAQGTDFGTWENAAFDFSDIEDNYVNKNGYVRYWNDAAKVPYLYNGDTGVYMSYDDQTAMMYKAAYIKSMDLAGVMVWEVSGDRNGTLGDQLYRDLPIDAAVPYDPLPAPDDVKASSVGASSVTAAWEASESATGYDVFVDKVWKGYTTNTSFTVTGLQRSTDYAIEIAAIERAGDDIARVSEMSEALNVRTSSSSGSVTGPSAPSGGSGAPAQVTRIDGKVLVEVDTARAVAQLDDSESSTIEIAVDNDGDDVEVVVGKELIEAIAGKGGDAALSLVTSGVEYVIPVRALQLPEGTADIRITVAAPSAEVLEQMEATGAKVLVDPLDFRIEIVGEDGAANELSDFGNVYVSRVFTLPSEVGDGSVLAGVMYDPANGEFRHVPTIVREQEDGALIVELKRAGNSIYTIVESAASFADVPAWAKADAEAAAAKYIASGIDETTFGAADLITRAEFVSIVARALGLSSGDAGALPFGDVAADTAYAGDIAAAYEAGIVAGRTADRFDPDGLIARQEMAAVLANAMKFAGYDTAADTASLSRFSDADSIAEYAKQPLALMAASGILYGTSDTVMDPKANATKAQAAVTAMRMLRTLGFATE